MATANSNDVDFSHYFSQKELQQLHEGFSLFDNDNDGTISSRELGTVLRSLGQNLRDDELQKMINEIDINGDGVISFNEFLHMMIDINTGTDEGNEIKAAFRVFDIEQLGFVYTQELKKTLLMVAEKEELALEEIEELCLQLDPHNTGKINFELFRKYIKN